MLLCGENVDVLNVKPDVKNLPLGFQRFKAIKIAI